MKCFKCEKPLEPAAEGLKMPQPSMGTMWTSSGNYGSTVFDPVLKNERLLILICDGCLTAGADLIHGFRNQEPVPAAELIA